ncbi:MAG: hypothetical protein ACXVA4_08290, partial [Ktedonobacterales bacterium]
SCKLTAQSISRNGARGKANLWQPHTEAEKRRTHTPPIAWALIRAPWGNSLESDARDRCAG